MSGRYPLPDFFKNFAPPTGDGAAGSFI